MEIPPGEVLRYLGYRNQKARSGHGVFDRGMPGGNDRVDADGCRLSDLPLGKGRGPDPAPDHHFTHAKQRPQ